MKIEKIEWMPIRGNLTIGDQSLKFVGENRGRSKKEIDEDDSDERPTCMIRSSLLFESGDIAAKIFIEKPDSKIQFRFGSNSDSVNVGTNIGDFPYGIALISTNGRRILNASGKGSQIPTNKDFDLKISIRGSTVELKINNVKMASTQIEITRAPLEIGFQGQGRIELKNLTINPVQPSAFVVMQFTDAYTALYKEVIEPVCSQFGYDVVRGDNIYNNGLVIEDIIQSINSCSLVIADITPNNANVYYEVGYAHGLRKPTILLSDRAREKLPFDISGFRLLFYDNTIGGKSVVEASLRQHLEALRANKF